MKSLLNLFRRSIAEDQGATLEKRKERDWRDAAVKKAAVKYGRPFKCAPDSLRREVLVTGADKKAVTVAVAEPGALPARTVPAPVSIFNKRGRA